MAAGQGTATAAAGGLGEGFEQRFGPVPSAIFATSTTLTSTGAVNVAHDSLPPLAGGVAMVNMMLGEVAPGGTGSGLYGLLILSIISVFIAGLMVGRTPEYLGKKIGPTEMKLAAMYILVTPTLVLALAGITVLLPDIMANAPATGPHQFSEVLYAFTSGANNNGSAFGGITTSGPYLSVMMGLAHAAGPLSPDRPGDRPGRLPRPSGQGSRLRRHRPHPRPAVRLAAARRDGDPDRPELLPGPCPGPPRRRTPQMTRSHTALATDTDAQTYADGNPLGTPGEHKHHTKAPAKLTLASVIAALPLAVRKLSPRQMIHSPVMFTVLVGAGLCTAISVYRPSVFGIAVTAWLWLTVLFGTLSESIAEGRGKAQADSLRASRKGVQARLRQPDGTTRDVPGTELRRGDVVICEAGDVIPSDGEIIEGLASVDESTITGESAPVIRESGGDRSSVTGGTKVLSDRIVIRITAEPGQTFIDRMIKLVEGAVRQKTPNEIALHVLLVSLTIVFLAVTMSLAPFAALAGATPSPIVLVALLVCLIPTTIGALVPAIGIAGMDRLVQHNVLATSGRAVETAGDITTLLLDKTGTITYGNRRAVNFFPANHVERTRTHRSGPGLQPGRRNPRGALHRGPRRGQGRDRGRSGHP